MIKYEFTRENPTDKKVSSGRLPYWSTAKVTSKYELFRSIKFSKKCKNEILASVFKRTYFRSN
jgi:hypothetical protein